MKKPFAETVISGTVGPHELSLQSEAWLARRSVIAGSIDDAVVELTATGRLFGSQELVGELAIGKAELAIEFQLRRIHISGCVGADLIDLTVERALLKPMKITTGEDMAAVHLEMHKRLKSGTLNGEVVRPADAFVVAAVSPTMLAIFDRRA
ncbi:MAG: hypothetical protein V3V01_11545 [Acidimicrobiales bacterium]